jgi:hypothetical protein
MYFMADGGEWLRLWVGVVLVSEEIHGLKTECKTDKTVRN